MLRRATLVALAMLVFVPAFAAPDGAEAPPADAAQGPMQADERLVGLIVQGRDLGAVFARLRGETWLLPLADAVRALGGELDATGARPRLATPIGAVDLPAEALVEIEGETFLDGDWMAARLNAPLRFSEEHYGLVVDLPWIPGDPVLHDDLDAAESPPEPEPDATPPLFGLTRLDGSAGFGLNSDGYAVDGASADLRLSGHALGGAWQVRLAEGFDENGAPEGERIEDYIWLRPITDTLWVQAGNQTLLVGPLVGAVETTGAQVAWSNRPSAFSGAGLTPGALLSLFGSGSRTFSGDGPPGGKAELWASGRRIAVTGIGIDGRWEIEDAPLFGQQTQLEIRLYRRASDAAPVEVQEVTVTRSARFQPKGTLMALAGVGVEGNPLDPDDDRGDGLAFARVQGAPFSWLTFGGSGIGLQDGDWLAGGDGAIELGPWASASGSVAFDPDGLGAWEGGFTAIAGPVVFDAGSFATRKGFADRFAEEEDEDPGDDVFSLLVAKSYDHRASLSWRDPGRRFEAGVMARSTDLAEFVLPFGWVEPWPGVSLSAWPDAAGDYRLEGIYGTDDGYDGLPFQVRLLRVEGGTSFRAEQDWIYDRLGDGLLYASVQVEDGGGWRAVLGGLGDRVDELDLDWRAEIGADQEGPALMLSLARILTPGVRGVADVAWDEGQARLFLGVSVDFGIRDGTFTGAPRERPNPRFGAVTGHFTDESGAPAEIAEAQRPEIRLDGQPAKVEWDGPDFRVANVPRGLRRVEVEPGGLPIELTPARASWLVEVAPGADTGLDLPLAMRLGVTGTVLAADGVPAAEVRIEILDDTGQVLARPRANTYGQFRADDLPPGRYRLRGGGGETPFELTDGFLFGLRLQGDFSATAEAASPASL